MKWFKNLKIGAKLISAFIAVALIAGVMGVIGIVNLNNTQKANTSLYNDYGVSLRYLSNIMNDYQLTRVNLLRVMSIKNSASRKTYVNNIKTYDNKIDENIAEYEKTANLA